MSSEKLSLKEILAAIDHGLINAWNEMTIEEQKSVSFWLLNRYVSSVKGSREKQELAVFKTNEYYNKHWNDLSKNHQELLWKLLCISGNTKKVEFHEWIGFKKKESKNKIINFLKEIYPNYKIEEIELLSELMSKKELNELANKHGIEIKF